MPKEIIRHWIAFGQLVMLCRGTASCAVITRLSSSHWTTKGNSKTRKENVLEMDPNGARRCSFLLIHTLRSFCSTQIMILCFPFSSNIFSDFQMIGLGLIHSVATFLLPSVLQRGDRVAARVCRFCFYWISKDFKLILRHLAASSPDMIHVHISDQLHNLYWSKICSELEKAFFLILFTSV